MLRLMKNRDSFRMICQAELFTGMLVISDYVSRLQIQDTGFNAALFLLVCQHFGYFYFQLSTSCA